MGKKKTVLKPCRHCWHCGRKLHGNHRATKIIHGNPHTFHKSCLKEYEQEQREEIQMKTFINYTGDRHLHVTAPP